MIDADNPYPFAHNHCSAWIWVSIKCNRVS